MITRRAFALAGFASAAPRVFAGTFRPQITPLPELAGTMGLVTASLTPHIAETPKEGQFRLIEFPGMLREELDLTVVDFNTMNFPTLEPSYVEKLRAAVDAAGCVATNLKMNQKVDMASPDASERAEAMRQYKLSIDAAELLGCRWVRPLPRAEKPDEGRQLAAFDELIDYAGERGLTVLLENFGYMMGDVAAVIRLAEAIGPDRVAIGPDTGNWTTNEVRYAGLANLFPRAVTCDFKAKVLGPDGGHADYDLERCFDLAWEAGFRGPWCFEHGHAKLAEALRGIAFLRNSVRKWMRERA